jgi:hypothetical protein
LLEIFCTSTFALVLPMSASSKMEVGIVVGGSGAGTSVGPGVGVISLFWLSPSIGFA